MEDLKKKSGLSPEFGLMYTVAAITAFITLFLIYRISLDFFDTTQMNTSLQMMDLSESQIILLDMIEIFIYIALLIILFIGVIKKNKKIAKISIVSIWVFVVIDFAVIEQIFKFKPI